MEHSSAPSPVLVELRNGVPEIRETIILDHAREGPIMADFKNFARTRYVGQDRIIDHLARTAQKARRGKYRNVRRPRPLESIIILGTSGGGKTEAFKLLAEFLFGDREACTIVHCSEYSERHMVTNFLGSPPGYVGGTDEVVITQEKLDKHAVGWRLRQFEDVLSEEELAQYQKALKDYAALLGSVVSGGGKDIEDVAPVTREERLKAIQEYLAHIGYPFYNRARLTYPSVVLFDELDQAHRSFFNLLYPILREAKLKIWTTEGKGRKQQTVDFQDAIIGATCNVGEERIREIFSITSGKAVQMGIMGRNFKNLSSLDQEIYVALRDALRQALPIPLINRFDIVLAARLFSREEYLAIIDIKLRELQDRLVNEWELSILLIVEDSVREFLLEKSTDDPEYGAELVERKIKKYISDNLMNLAETGQVNSGDVVAVSAIRSERGKKEVVFKKEIAKPRKRPLLVLSPSQK